MRRAFALPWDAMRRASPYVQLGLLASAVACGNDATGGQGSGEGDAGVSGEDVSAGLVDPCAESALPSPFCHEYVVYYDPLGTVVGVQQYSRDGYRGLLTLGDSSLRAIHPLDAADVFAEIPAPFNAESWGSGLFEVVNGDLTGDGTPEVVISNEWGLRAEVAVLDHDLSPIASLTLPAVHGFHLGVFDADLDGVANLVTGHVSDEGATVSVWSLEAGELELFAQELIDVSCAGWAFTAGDYNGDTHSDIAIVWEDWCTPSGPPHPVVTLIAGLASPVTLGARLSEQPVLSTQAVSGDIDGDADSELVLVDGAESFTVLDWSDAGFVPTMEVGPEDLILGFTGPAYGLRAAPGAFALLLGNYQPDEGFDPKQMFYAALFPADSSIRPIPLPRSPTLVSDVNNDGIDDIVASGDSGEVGLYISLPHL